MSDVSHRFAIPAWFYFTAADEAAARLMLASISDTIPQPFLTPDKSVDAVFYLGDGQQNFDPETITLSLEDVFVANEGNSPICRRCHRIYPEAGDGWNGLCPDCVDAAAGDA